MSRHQLIRIRWFVLGLGAWIAAATGNAQAQGWGPYQNPYAAAPYGGVGPGYGPGYPAAPGYPPASGFPAAYGQPGPSYSSAGQPGWPEDDAAQDVMSAPTTGQLASSSTALARSTYARSTYAAGPRMGGGFLYLGGPENAAAPNAHIDVAPVFTHIRLRTDAAWDNPTPDRAEYIQAKNGFFRTAPGALNDPDAPGPALLETRLHYNDIRPYLEVAVSPLLSGFVEMPFRFLDPEQNGDTSGFGDMNAGVKAALIDTGSDYLTFQLTTYFPTGDADRGLGTSHLTIEPALLFLERLNDRLSLYGEARYWIPIEGTHFAGEIVRYGVGTGYDLGYGSRGNERVTALAELVGWTITHGGVFDGNNVAAGIQDAADDTIMNLVLGMRYTLGTGSFAATWSTAMSHPVWYEDMLRLEYRRAF